MAIRILVGACAGVSLLALAQAAAAQDHSRHAPPTTTAPSADPHAGHDMPMPTADAMPVPDMSGFWTSSTASREPGTSARPL